MTGLAYSTPDSIFLHAAVGDEEDDEDDEDAVYRQPSDEGKQAPD